MNNNSIQALFENELKDIYDAEKRLTKALPKMAKAAASDELRSAFEEHLQITKGQVSRLEQIFEMLERKPQAKTCPGMKGLIEEADEILGTKGEAQFSDIAIIGAARKVEHYEMMAYTTLRSIAEQIGDEEMQNLIDETMREEEEADEKLADICEQLMESMADSSDEEEDVDDEDEDEDDEDDEEDDEELLEDDESEEEEEEEPVSSGKEAPAPQGRVPGRRNSLPQ
jgi:ferritin-like metal-binding protein YciE